VALLLVSPNFLASPFIADEEIPPILAAARTDGLVIVWVLISACLYQRSAIAEYQAAHPIAKPLDSLAGPKRNQMLLAIAETIGAALGDSKRRV
jgi:internalin A